MRARLAVLALTWIVASAATDVPSGVHVTLTDQALTFVHDGTVLSTATVCPGYEFDTFGITGPRFSPDNHWVLVDVVGPFTPGNVLRTHALVQVRSGRIVLAPSFPAYLGIPTSLEPMAWASGQRATIAYSDGKTATIREPLGRALPSDRCAGPKMPTATAPPAGAPAPASSATPFPF